ncbi:uncharacterized protein LOC125044150 [Penaeus chinensis]|uniref:uncharacterized protein LOC125044150 n=1 Tax=Penaeus chinensis TaxID=139456 RepID=UPI001FB747ED|nr:uncharacterized protein LOC125044150 [Penaeus chinensis]
MTVEHIRAVQSLITSWGRQWQVTLPFDKTQLMLKSRRQNPLTPSTSINRQTLDLAREMSILGEKFNNQLPFTSHLKDVAKRADRPLVELKMQEQDRQVYFQSLLHHRDLAPLCMFFKVHQQKSSPHFNVESAGASLNLHQIVQIGSTLVEASRIRRQLLPKITETQFGFTKDKAARNATFVMRMPTERAIQRQQNMYLVFIDYQKAFDKVQHLELLKVLINIRIVDKDMRLIQSVYQDQVAAVRLSDGTANWFSIKRGVRQVCVRSPNFFNLCCKRLKIVRRESTSAVARSQTFVL